jgi:signal transduction histidine kinase
MHGIPRRLLQPLTLAGLFTLGAVALAMQYVDSAQRTAGWTLLGTFTTLFMFAVLSGCRDWRMWLATTPMPLLALALIALDPRPGVAPVLLVIWVAVGIGLWPTRLIVSAALLADAAFWLILRHAGFDNPFVVMLINASFQVFAGLCVHYARSAEQARDALVRVNADLLATRALLAESARDAERLRVARELHDVAGHKLTALKLNLRALADDPALAARPGLRVAGQLAGELLDDLRGVVRTLRDSRGLDLETAIRALAVPLPQPVLHLRIDPGVQVADPAQAETVLRVVQEALTNAARHSHARVLDVHLARGPAGLRLHIEDDGRVRVPLREGSGLAGMRERLVAARGELRLAIAPAGHLVIDASLPA